MIQDFFTWQNLLTQAGAMGAVLLFTQLLKDVQFLKKVPTRITSYAIAFAVLVLALLFTGALTAETACLALINAAVVSVAANGGYDLLKQGVSSKNNIS